MNTDTTTQNDASKIDAMIAAAKQRKAQRAAGEENAASGQAVERAVKKSETTPEEKAAREAEKAAARAKKDAERATKKAEKQAIRDAQKTERDERRATKKAERDAERGSRKPHTSKLEKARTKLPVLSRTCEQIIDLINGYKSEVELHKALTSAELIALSQHLEFAARERQTTEALNAKLEVGQRVRIVSGKDPRMLGTIGTLQKVQRIRCYVEVPGVSHPVYLFTSDVVPIESDDVEASSAADDAAGEEAA